MDSRPELDLSFKGYSVMSTSTLIVSIVNMIISIILFFIGWKCIEGPDYIEQSATLMAIILNIALCSVNIRLLYALHVGKICRVLFCLEVFVVLFILNIIPMTSEEPDPSFIHDDSFKYENMNRKYEKMRIRYNITMMICKIFYAIIVVEIYLVYRYYNYELKCSQQNISLATPLLENPSAPAEQYQMAPSHHTTQQPAQCITQQPGQNLIQHSGQNITQQPDQCITQESRQYVIQQPGTSAFNPQHVMQGPFPPGQSIVQQSVTSACCPPPYPGLEDNMEDISSVKQNI